MTKLEFIDKINDILIGLNTAESDALGGLYDELMRSQWIPVEEELPKEGQVVLIHTQGGSVSTACYTDGRFDITELFQAINVTHWMPIVPPRKEE